MSLPPTCCPLLLPAFPRRHERPYRLREQRGRQAPEEPEGLDRNEPEDRDQEERGQRPLPDAAPEELSRLGQPLGVSVRNRPPHGPQREVRVRQYDRESPEHRRPRLRRSHKPHRQRDRRDHDDLQAHDSVRLRHGHARTRRGGCARRAHYTEAGWGFVGAGGWWAAAFGAVRSAASGRDRSLAATRPLLESPVVEERLPSGQATPVEGPSRARRMSCHRNHGCPPWQGRRLRLRPAALGVAHLADARQGQPPARVNLRHGYIRRIATGMIWPHRRPTPMGILADEQPDGVRVAAERVTTWQRHGPFRSDSIAAPG